MASYRIGVLSSGTLELYSSSGAELTPPLTFEATTAGRARFAEHLQITARRPIRLLVDAVEEEFREETVPHVYWTDRRALLRTRMRRLFDQVQYHHAVVQARDSGGRRDDRVLFSALTRADLLSSWLQIIAEQDIPLVGVSSLPLMTEQLLAWLRIKDQHALIVTLQRSGSLRQSFFQHGKLRISRLAVLEPAASMRLAAAIHTEINNIRHYLNSLQLSSDRTPLSVYVLGSAPICDELKLLVEADHGLYRVRYIFLHVAAIVAQLNGGRPSTNDSIDTASADILFVLWAYKKGVVNHYASADNTYRYRSDRIKQGLMAASILMLVSSFAYAGMQIFDGVRSTSDSALLKQQVDFYSARYEQAKNALPSSSVAPQQLREVVQLAIALQQRRANPIAMLQAISHGLAAADELHLRKLTWKNSPDPKATFAGQLPTDAPVAAAATPVAADAALNPDPLYQIALIDGDIQGHTNYRVAIARILHFADVLRANPAVEYVEVLSLPLRLGSQQTVSGHTANQLPDPGFQLKLALPIAIPNPAHAP